MSKMIDQYTLIKSLGSGHFGTVYLGLNDENNQQVAIKCIKRSSVKGNLYKYLEYEVKILKNCDNKNIVKLFDVKKTQNNYYLIMEYCNEGDLSVLIAKKRILQENEVIDIFLQILNAFKYLIQNNIIHRDLKPANILMNDKQVKVADFGLSKVADSNTMM